MTVDRTPKPCLHKIADHRNGTRLGYVLDRCRCLPCCHAASVYEQQRTKNNAYGRANLIDATPARQHVARLMAAGVGLKRIVKMSGISQGALWKLMYGKKRPDGVAAPSARVTRATAARLLALDPADPTLLAGGATIGSTGTARRLQALACMGWSVGRITAGHGLDRQALDAAVAGKPVVAATARVVAALYEQLWDQRPTAADRFGQAGITRTINRANAADWAPPLAWEDDTIDDPTAVPDLGEARDLVDERAVDVVLEGVPLTLHGATLHAAVHALAARGDQPAQIATRLGIHVRQAERLRDRDDAPRPHGRSTAA